MSSLGDSPNIDFSCPAANAESAELPELSSICVSLGEDPPPSPDATVATPTAAVPTTVAVSAPAAPYLVAPLEHLFGIRE